MSIPVRDDVFVISGFPRGGTTYLAAVLHRPPRIITLSEAQGRWKQLYRDAGEHADPLPVFGDMRAQICAGQPMPTLEDTPGMRGEGRIDTWNQGKRTAVIDADEEFVLGMKNPEAFLAWLPRFIEAGVRCVISVRHPASVINSWVRRGRERVARNQTLDGTFANGDAVTFQATAVAPVDRRIELMNHFAAQIDSVRAHSLVHVVRHEDWYAEARLDRIWTFLGVRESVELRPRPIAPDPIDLAPDEVARICRECAQCNAFGYPVDHSGALAVPGSCASAERT